MEQQKQLKIEQEISPEKEGRLRTMKEHIKHSLENETTQEKVADNFSYVFEQLGLSPEEAKRLCDNIFTLLSSDKSLSDIEKKALHIFENIKLKFGDKEASLIEILHEKMKDRVKIIASQVAPHFEDIKGKVIDYGAGDGQVTQKLHDQLGLDIEGVDVRLYKDSNVTIPIMLLNSDYVEVADGTYEAALLTNVLHHEKANEKIFDELDRIVRRKLVIIETIPVGENEEIMEQDKDRTFMNDYLHNRLFHNDDVPVPGTFETPKKWVDRFAQHGWKLVNEEDFGFDQPIFKLRHYLFVFEK